MNFLREKEKILITLFLLFTNVSQETKKDMHIFVYLYTELSTQPTCNLNLFLRIIKKS